MFIRCLPSDFIRLTSLIVRLRPTIISNFSLCKQWLATLERTSLHLFVHERSLKALSIYLCMEICAKYYLACPIEFGTCAQVFALIVIHVLHYCSLAVSVDQCR